MNGARFVSIALLFLVSACVAFGPVGNRDVPEPVRSVDIKRYLGLWYEIGRYENGFERGCEGVTAEYSLGGNGEVRVLNTCHLGSPSGPSRSSEGSAKFVRGSNNAKFKVSFFGPLYVGDYWVLDRASDYSWSLVGEPSGRYLWLLSRDNSPAALTKLTRRAAELGYDISLIRPTKQ
jgi:apolipoprotein D and lipocalin family protein